MQKNRFSISISLLLLFFTNCIAQEWEALGPFYHPVMQYPNDFTQKMANGIGRVSCLRFGEIDSNKVRPLYLGSPFGGLYNSIDDGSSWNEMQLGNFTPGISDYKINPKDRKIQYVLTGDPDCILDPNSPALGTEFCQSGGIYVSKDAGITWSNDAIGIWYDFNGKVNKDFWKFPSFKVLRRLLINPLSPNKMYAVIHTYNYQTRTFDGYVYQTTDGGQKWKVSLYSPGDKLKDIEFNPSNPKIIYAGGKTVHRTSNGGKKWQLLQSNGLLPDSISSRCEIATFPKRSNLVYVLIGNRSTKQNEIYFSNDNGITFKYKGRAAGSPEWRTALAVDPSDTGRIYFTTGNKVGCFLNDGREFKNYKTVSTIHDDVHDLTTDPLNGRIYASTDGGLYMSSDNGETWINMNNGLNVAECWGVAVTQNTPLRILSGLQDCGTILFDEDSIENFLWKTVKGGDGMGAAYNPSNPQICYSADGNNNLFSKSVDGGYRWSRNLGIYEEPFTYQHPFALNPMNPSSIFLPYHNVYKSIDRGENFSKLDSDSLPPKTESIVAIAIAPSDSNIIYIGYSNPTWSEITKGKMFMSSNGGNSWTDISAGLDGVKYLNITSIIVDPKNPLHVTVGFHGAGKIKAMTSVNGGRNISWVDYSEGLPVEADINSMIYDLDENITLYAATHRGVWKRNKNSAVWTIAGKGLPAMMVSDLDICYDSHQIYVGTHGRGVWKMQLE